MCPKGHPKDGLQSVQQGADQCLPKEEPWDLCDLPQTGHISDVSAFSEQVRERKKIYFLFLKSEGKDT